MTPAPARPAKPRRLIYIDTAYTLKIVRNRRHEDYWMARHSGDYFPIVWGVHPFSDIPDNERRNKTRLLRFAPRQVAIEGTSQLLSLPKWLLPINFLVSQALLLRSLIKRGKKYPIDAIFVNDPLYAGLFGLLLAWRLRVPLIVFVPAHFDDLYDSTGALGAPRIFRTRKVEQAAMRTVFRRATMVFAAADNLAAMALKYGAPPKSIARLSHGKYIASYHLCPPDGRAPPGPVLAKYRIPDAPNYLIFIGRQTLLKHPEDALLAMKIAFEGDPDVIGIMAGIGDLNDYLKAKTKELQIDSRVFFPGLLYQPSLSLLLPRCICLSPLTGMALIEAALGGAPVVAYDRDWQSEFIYPGVTGALVPDRDWEAMGNAALEILRDPERRKAFAKAGRARAIQFVDLKSNQDKEHAAFDAMFDRWASKRRQRNQTRQFSN